MRLTRIFLPKPLLLNQEVALTPAASHHLLKVLRLSMGAPLIIFNGEGGEYHAELINTNNKIAVVRLEKFTPINRESLLQIHLGQAISRGEKMDFTLQKAVELGVTKITPLFTRFSNVKLNEERLAKKMLHWQGIIISACEQSGRNVLPELSLPQAIENWLPQQSAALKLILDPQGDRTLSQFSASQEVCLLVGAEGGLSAEEIQLAHQHRFQSLQLGPRILRTETAALVMLSMLQGSWGDLR